MFGKTEAKDLSKAISEKLKEEKGDAKEGVDLVGLAKDLAKRKVKKAKKSKE